MGKRSGAAIACGVVAAVGLGLFGAEIIGADNLRDQAQAVGVHLFGYARLAEVEVHGFPKVADALRQRTDRIDYHGDAPDGAGSMDVVASGVDFAQHRAATVDYLLTIRNFAENARPVDGTPSDFTVGPRQYRTVVTRHGDTASVIAVPSGVTTVADDGITRASIGPFTVQLPELPTNAKLSGFSGPHGITVSATVNNAILGT